VGDLTSPKSQGNLAFIAIVQKAPNIAHLDVVVAVISSGSELDFFDFNHLLLRLRFRGLLLLLVFELAVVHQTTDWGHRSRGNFNQINIQLTGHAQGVSQADNAQGLIFRAGEANLGGHDFTVQSVLALFPLAAVTKFSSDGSNPQKISVF
jgi:hypothetical protein